MDAEAAEGFEFAAAETAGDEDDLGEILFASEFARLPGLDQDEFLEQGLFGGFEVGEVGIAVAAAERERGATGLLEREVGFVGAGEFAEDFVE